MNELTIRPLAKFIAAQGRTELTAGDLQQLQGQLKRKIAQKEQQGLGIRAEKLYMGILTAQDYFAGRRRITVKELLSQVSTLLIDQNYGYTRKIHWATHSGNSFYGHRTSPGKATPPYDLAFYHVGSPPHSSHYRNKKQNSVFYMRCEVALERILFGNLQIDDRGREPWRDKALGEELRRPKNIYRMMIQQAVKYGVEIGKKDIWFQAGVASEIAQWSQAAFAQLQVTKKNFAQINELYARKVRWLGQPPGAVLECSNDTGTAEVVVSVARGVCTTRRLCTKGPSVLMEVGLMHRGKAYADPHSSGSHVGDVVWDGAEACAQVFRQPAAGAKVHAQLNKLIKDLTGVSTPATAAAAQIAELTALRRKAAANLSRLHARQFMLLIEEYLTRWGYDQIIIKKFPGIKKLNLQRPCPPGELNYVYYNGNSSDNKKTYRQKDYRAPVLGQSYLVPSNNKLKIDFRTNLRLVARARVHSWYEMEIPAQLKKLGLGCEKVQITTRKNGRLQAATAWKVTTGLAEFAKRPLELF